MHAADGLERLDLDHARSPAPRAGPRQCRPAAPASLGAGVLEGQADGGQRRDLLAAPQPVEVVLVLEAHVALEHAVALELPARSTRLSHNRHISDFDPSFS